MQTAGYNIWIPLEIGDIIQGQKYDTIATRRNYVSRKK